MRVLKIFSVGLVLLLALSTPYLIAGSQGGQEVALQEHVPVIIMFNERQEVDLVGKFGGKVSGLLAVA